MCQCSDCSVAMAVWKDQWKDKMSPFSILVKSITEIEVNIKWTSHGDRDRETGHLSAWFSIALHHKNITVLRRKPVETQRKEEGERAEQKWVEREFTEANEMTKTL